MKIGEKIIMADGSLCDDESLSWWYHEDGNGNDIGKTLAYVMDLSIHFPYWEELKPPEGYNHAVNVGDVWHWAFATESELLNNELNPERSVATDVK